LFKWQPGRKNWLGFGDLHVIVAVCLGVTEVRNILGRFSFNNEILYIEKKTRDKF
jgi:hypothetical protein